MEDSCQNSQGKKMIWVGNLQETLPAEKLLPASPSIGLQVYIWTNILHPFAKRCICNTFLKDNCVWDSTYAMVRQEKKFHIF